MKTIIAGSRDIVKDHLVFSIVETSGFEITEVVSGHARGVDQLGEQYAGECGLPIRIFPVTDLDWRNVNAPGARIKTRKDGTQYNANAGRDRNTQMAEYADALIAVWDGQSPGTRHMIGEAYRLGLKVHVCMVINK